MLFSKLQQGVQENEQILTIARMRAEAEDLYGQKLGDIDGATNRISDGFQRDDGATVKKVGLCLTHLEMTSRADDPGRHTKESARK